MKSHYILLAVLTASATASATDYKVEPAHGSVAYGSEPTTVTVNASAPASVRCTVTRDIDADTIFTMTQGSTTRADFSFNLEPGFYRCILSDTANDSVIASFNFGRNPESIISPVDARPDFDEFWEKAKAELAAQPMDASRKLLKDKSGKKRRTYLVKMKSLGGVEIQGYLTLPTGKGRKYPATIHYMGYGADVWNPAPDDNPEMIEFVLSVRGQGLDKPTNKYGDWIVWNLENPDEYYYRGAFMDLLRAIDYVTSLPEWDGANLYAEGGSQGGAFTLAACALDHRITAAAPWIPFLSDYPDYFRIVHWPADPVKAKAAELGMTDSRLYSNLSYFDIKNFAGKITCPIIMGVGLQDPTCPPHTNFAGYNLITSPKQYIIYEECGHDVRHSDWWTRTAAFFESNRR